MSLTFSTRSSIEELWTRYGAESVHARQVAELALKLFDATRAIFGIPAGDRDRLEAACLLHDIAYGINPRRHAELGAGIVRRRGIEGLVPADARWIASLIRLHPASLTFERARARAARAPESRRVLYAAALLRIADALDSSHLQDASVASVHVMKRRIRVGIRSALFPGNVGCGQLEAVRWRQAFPVDLELRLLAGGPRVQLLAPSVLLHEGVRRLLFLNFRTMLANVPGTLDGVSAESLHDLRIAVRRMRSVLRAFRGPLKRTSAARVDRDLQQVNRILGIARDLDVWIGFFSTEAMSAQFTGHRLWPRFVAHQIALRRLQQATVRRQIHGARFAALQSRIERLLRVELPAEAVSAPPVALVGPARRALAKGLRRALGLGRWRHSRSPEKLHRLRIALRRLRYLGVFFGPLLGRSVRKVSRRAHALERVLGGMRDADLILSRILQEGPTPPRLLVKQLERRRQADAATLESAWTRFEDPESILDVRRQLKRRGSSTPNPK